MITLPDTLALRIEALAGEALQAMETANDVAAEPIYTSSSLSAAFATLEELKAILRAQNLSRIQGHSERDQMDREELKRKESRNVLIHTESGQ